MKIKASQLPADIAATLAPRTFAQERPEDGQLIEIEFRSSGKWLLGRITAASDKRITCDMSDKAIPYVFTLDARWRPILEIEDDAPEPERELPEPKPGAYFIAEGRAAYRTTDGDLWHFMTNETDHGISDSFRELSSLPPDWQPLSSIIEKAARAGELQVRWDSEALARQRVQVHLDEARDKLKQAAAKAEELEAKLQRANKEAEAAWDAAEKRLKERRDLEAKLKQQDAICELASRLVYRGLSGTVSVDTYAAAPLLVALEARRKAQEAG